MIETRRECRGMSDTPCKPDRQDPTLHLPHSLSGTLYREGGPLRVNQEVITLIIKNDDSLTH